MNSNYKIITDYDILEDFVYNFLPDLSKNETYYVCLFARSKYQDKNNKTITHIKSDKAQLKRFTSNKERLISKIEQLECKLGVYKQYGVNKETVDIPQETLALYITPNPRNVFKATKNCIKKFVDLVCDGDGNIVDPHRFAMSEIQRSKSRTCFVDFDIDLSEYYTVGYHDYKNVIETILPIDSFHILQTRGGFHVLVEPNKVKNNKNWYQQMSNLKNIDQTGDCMIPVPGTYQGGFTPYFLNRNF